MLHVKKILMPTFIFKRHFLCIIGISFYLLTHMYLCLILVVSVLHRYIGTASTCSKHLKIL